MPVYINFICDHESQLPDKGCLLQPISFDSLEETWQDMLIAIQQAGWKLEMNDAKVVKCYCPDHK